MDGGEEYLELGTTPDGNKMNFFWGSIGATAYPMHRDIRDGDNFMQILSGCKEAVVIHEEEEQLHTGEVFGSEITGTTAYYFNPFNAKASKVGEGPKVRKGWYGRFYSGELIF